MNLYISSFKIIGYFFIMFIAYNLYLIVFEPQSSRPQSQYKDNLIIAEKFIYSNKDNMDTVIVGSSMARLIHKNLLPENIYNLAFGGDSVLTGLNIIKKSGFMPKKILIEANIIFKDKNQEMLNSLFHPALFYIKKYIPALRENSQPFNLLLSLVFENTYSHEKLMSETIDLNMFNIHLNTTLNTYQKALLNYEQQVSELKQLFEFFKYHNTEILFFYMPNHTKIMNSKLMQEQNNVILQNFKYKWLETSQDYQTQDGIHLTYEQADIYTKDFVNLLK